MKPYEHPEELLSAYFDGCLDAEEKDRIESHLTSCSQCQNRIQQWREMKGMLQVSAHFPVSPYFPARILALYKKKAEDTIWGIMANFFKPVVRIAFVAVLMLISMWFWPDSGRSRRELNSFTESLDLSLIVGTIDTAEPIQTDEQALRFALNERELPQGGTR